MDTINDIVSGLKWGDLEPIEAHNRIKAIIQMAADKKLPSDDDMKKLVEQIAYKRMGEDQMDDLIAKMGLLIEFLNKHYNDE